MAEAFAVWGWNGTLSPVRAPGTRSEKLCHDAGVDKLALDIAFAITTLLRLPPGRNTIRRGARCSGRGVSTFRCVLQVCIAYAPDGSTPDGLQFFAHLG